MAAGAPQSRVSCPVGHLPLWLRLLEQAGSSTVAPGQRCQEEQAEPSVVAAISESCLWPTEDELGKKIIVMLMVCTKVMRSHLVLVPPSCCSVAGRYK